jgi:hypothetical protein
MSFSGKLQSDSLSPADQPPPPRSQADIRHFYSQLGRVMLVAEAACPGVGIPWLPPTRRTANLRREYFQTLKDYVRCSLASVSTTVLESYAEDLEKLPISQESTELLGIAGLTRLERWSLSIILFSICFTGFMFASLVAHASLALTLGLSFAVSALVAAVSIYICSEPSRRTTFHWLVTEEIMRRKGLDQQNLGLPITVFPQTPVSEG